jgi:hypothetical protein
MFVLVSMRLCCHGLEMRCAVDCHRMKLCRTDRVRTRNFRIGHPRLGVLLYVLHRKQSRIRLAEINTGYNQREKDMPVTSARIGSLRTVKCLCIFAALLLGRPLAQSQAPAAKNNSDPKTWAYNMRSFARVAGNVGGWWSFMNENEKAAFLDGFQEAMTQSLSQNEILCRVVKDGVKPSSDQQAFNNQMVVAIGICTHTSDFAGFEKITTKDLDDFYSDPVNQAILLEWALGYLRDKESGRKTEGQLLDTLKAEQKDVHDCSKYPSLCKLGAKESQP